MIKHWIFIFSSRSTRSHPKRVPFGYRARPFPKVTAFGPHPFYALAVDFEWVEWQCPTLAGESAGLLGDVRQVQCPGRKLRAGIYRGLERAADWDRMMLRGRSTWEGMEPD